MDVLAEVIWRMNDWPGIMIDMSDLHVWSVLPVCEDQFFGLHCMMQCHCNDNEVCDKLNGKCPRLCAPGYNGTACQSGGELQ